VKLLQLELEAEPNDPSPEPDDGDITIQLAISNRQYSRVGNEKTRRISSIET